MLKNGTSLFTNHDKPKITKNSIYWAPSNCTKSNRFETKFIKDKKIVDN
jgi:hypothetical protein